MKFLKQKFILGIIVVFSVFFYAFPGLVQAITQEQQDRCDKLKASLNITITNDQLSSWKGNVVDGLPTYCSAEDLVTVLLKYMFAISGTAAVLFIILGGFWYMTSAGNEEQAEKGQKTITYAIIGLVAVIMSYTIVRITTGIFFTNLPDSPNIKKDAPDSTSTPAVESPSDPADQRNPNSGELYTYEPWINLDIADSVVEGGDFIVYAEFDKSNLDVFKEFCSGAAPEKVSLDVEFDGRKRGTLDVFELMAGSKYEASVKLVALKPTQVGDRHGAVTVSVCGRKVGGRLIFFETPTTKPRN